MKMMNGPIDGVTIAMGVGTVGALALGTAALVTAKKARNEVKEVRTVLNEVAPGCFNDSATRNRKRGQQV